MGNLRPVGQPPQRAGLLRQHRALGFHCQPTSDGVMVQSRCLICCLLVIGFTAEMALGQHLDAPASPATERPPAVAPRAPLRVAQQEGSVQTPDVPTPGTAADASIGAPSARSEPRLANLPQLPDVPVRATEQPPRLVAETAAQSKPQVRDTFQPAAVNPSPVANVVSAAELPALPVEEAGSLLQRSNSVQTVRAQTRSPVAVDPRIRGFRMPQIYSQVDGGMLMSARTDLETMLSKIDPALIESATVIPGPYGLRHGPGLAFLHVVTSPTPRYDCYEAHHQSGFSVRANGGQMFGRHTFYGGSRDWGFLMNYGLRTGSDYEAGDGSQIPASYHINNYWGQLGFDTQAGEQIEFRYQRVNQSDTEYAGQFFDISGLHADSFVVNYLFTETDLWSVKLDVWHNQTRFGGDTGLPGEIGKRPPITSPATSTSPPTYSTANFFQAYNVINRVVNALAVRVPSPDLFGFTNGEVETTGGRAVWTLGTLEDAGQVSLGTDLRFQRQRIDEDFQITRARNPNDTNTSLGIDGRPIEDQFGTNLPNSTAINPGLFTEWTREWNPRWRSNVGLRVDWVDAQVRSGLRSGTSLAIDGVPVDSVDELRDRDLLYAFYWTHDVRWSDSISYHLGGGLGQRPATLLERYADGIFLAILQNGFSRMIGNPELDPERSWQVDISMDFRRPNFRGRISAFHSWVSDYITFLANEIDSPADARLIFLDNTKRATLFGFEYYGELDLTRQWMSFASLSYVEGEDQVIDQPLAAIPPLEARLGLRIVDRPTRGEDWGFEFGARVTDDQDRFARVRDINPNNPGLVAVEEATPGYAIFYVRGYANATERLRLTGGIENLADRAYLDHLNLRYPVDGSVPASRIFGMGITPYFGVELTY